MLSLAAPPLRLAPPLVLYELSLPEALALFLHSRRLERDRRAEQLEMLALQLEAQAMIGGTSQSTARQFVAGYRTQATQLRRPSWPVDYGPLPPGLAKFLNPPPPEPEG